MNLVDDDQDQFREEVEPPCPFLPYGEINLCTYTKRSLDTYYRIPVYNSWNVLYSLNSVFIFFLQEARN